ncbi:MAG TPA: BON domain-containing protein, partial [Pyrinomonadaceae bacterium]|nr:BON domain-containing protein [Pyrinomonadaceae bacterium]
MKAIKNGTIAFFASLVLTVSALAAVPADQTARPVSFEQVSKKVRKELVTLPYYGVFDNLAYKVDGSTVTLYGQVVRPTTRSDAERRVARLKGVERVVNQIEVLPLSPFDDRLRRSTYYT